MDFNDSSFIELGFNLECFSLEGQDVLCVKWDCICGGYRKKWSNWYCKILKGEEIKITMYQGNREEGKSSHTLWSE